jgi:hypothetical protein
MPGPQWRGINDGAVFRPVHRGDQGQALSEKGRMARYSKGMPSRHVFRDCAARFEEDVREGVPSCRQQFGADSVAPWACVGSDHGTVRPETGEQPLADDLRDQFACDVG